MIRIHSHVLSFVAALAAAALSNTAHAGMVTYTTTTVPATTGFGVPTPSPTEVHTNILLPLWDPSLFPGETLTGVEITMPTTLSGLISVTNNTTDVVTATATTSSTGSLGSFIPFIVSATTGPQTLGPGDTYNSPMLTGTSTFDSGLITTGLATYTGSGSLSLPYDTLTSLLLSAGGGNIAATQTTSEAGVPTVTYTYENSGNSGNGVPEPASMGLLALGALGLLWRRRK